MTWSIALIGLVAVVGLMHLTENAMHALAGPRGRRAADQRRMMAAGGERGDWYMFFHCSDVTGKETAKEMSERDERRQAVGMTPARRGSDRRPRIGLSR